MISSSIAFAAAANAFPTPFVKSGVADVAIVSGANAAQSDMSAALDIAAALSSHVTSSTGNVSVSGESWMVGTSSDDLEIGEAVSGIENYIDSGNLPTLLADGEISNEKGDAEYSQYLYFDQAANSKVTYTEDDDDNIGLFYKVADGSAIARYVLDFTTNLESDIDSDSHFTDIEDEQISMLGKTYTVTSATNSSSTVTLTLLSGAIKGVATSESQNFGGYDVSVLVTADTKAKFTVNGVTTDTLAKGDLEKLSDGNYLSVSDITYQNFAGGIASAEFFIGADKLEMTNGQDLKVNAETISDADVTISASFSGGDVSISEIDVNMTASDDLFVPVGGRLSQASALDEPQVLLTQNWDIIFNGLADSNYEDVSLKSTSSDSKYVLEFENADGDSISLPVAFANTTGIFVGDERGKELILNTTASIAKNQYFVLNTANPATASNDAKSFVLQYKGANSVSDDAPKATFDVLGVDSNKEVSINSTGGFDIKLGGSTFSFTNTSSAGSDDYTIALSGTANGLVGQGGNQSVAMRLRSKYNSLITINDTNATTTTSNVVVTVVNDDTDRDDDFVDLSGAPVVFSVALSNSSGEVETGTVTSNGTLQENPENDDESIIINNYGDEVHVVDTTDSPAQITAKIPERVVKPSVYVAAVSGVSGGSTTGNIVPIKDSEASSVTNKNLIIVGGSCINTVAAEILSGSAVPVCGADFTAKTGIGAGQYLIQTVSRSGGKVATLVAGYNAADTTNAATALKTQASLDLTAGKTYVGSATTAPSLQ